MLKRQELEGEKNDGLNTRSKLLPGLSEGLGPINFKCGSET